MPTILKGYGDIDHDQFQTMGRTIQKLFQNKLNDISLRSQLIRPITQPLTIDLFTQSQKQFDETSGTIENSKNNQDIQMGQLVNDFGNLMNADLILFSTVLHYSPIPNEESLRFLKSKYSHQSRIFHLFKSNRSHTYISFAFVDAKTGQFIHYHSQKSTLPIDEIPNHIDELMNEYLHG